MASANITELRESQLAPRPAANMPAIRAGFFDLEGFELLQRVAKMFASSTLVPKQYQGNVANCSIALNLARRLGADELMVMQNLYIVHGNPGWSAKFLIACINTCGRYESLRYEWRGDEGGPSRGCRAWTIEKSTGEKLFGTWIDWAMVRAEKWDKKDGSKWLTMPEQMFMYRAAAFWQRAYAPEISMGLMTAEELADVVDVRADGTYSVSAESLRADMRRVDQSTGEVLEATVERAAAPTRAPAAEKREPASAPAAPAPAATAQRQAAPPAFDANAFAERIESCKDLPTLKVLGSELQSIEDDDARSTLEDMFLRRQGELEASAPQQQAAAPAPASRRARAPSSSVAE